MASRRMLQLNTSVKHPSRRAYGTIQDEILSKLLF